MQHDMYSVEQVADLLDLHVKTVRGYVRDGKLKAVRIGKQYRIARGDLEEFTGGIAPRPARETAARTRHSEASTIVQVDAIDFDTMSRVSTTLSGAVQGRDHTGQPLRVDTVYDEERASLKVVVIGGLEDTAALLNLTAQLLERTR
ncbi:helix-turn-helix domain-containing protein [Flindersiella endophytica]